MNFTFLKNKTEFQDFASTCIEAEKGLMVSPANCAILTRRALEQAVHYMYKNDIDLQMPYRDNLSALVNEYTFKQIIPTEIYEGIRYVITLGNFAVHTSRKVKREEAVLALNNLYRLVNWMNYSYGVDYQQQLPEFDPTKLPDQTHMFVNKDLKEQVRDILNKQKEKEEKQKEELARLVAENEELRRQGAAKRKEDKAVKYVDVNKIPEWRTRQLYINLMLKEAGWDFDTNVEEEYPVHHMPTDSKEGFVDYILRGRTGKIIAVIEAKKTRGVIVFTDPDSPGNRIRHAVNQSVGGCKNAFVMKKDARTDKKVGVEHATYEILKEALENVVSFDEDDCCQLTMNDMIELGLSGSDNSSALRDAIGEHFHIGSGNAKTMLRRINFSKITKEELYKVIHS